MPPGDPLTIGDVNFCIALNTGLDLMVCSAKFAHCLSKSVARFTESSIVASFMLLFAASSKSA